MTSKSLRVAQSCLGVEENIKGLGFITFGYLYRLKHFKKSSILAKKVSDISVWELSGNGFNPSDGCCNVFQITPHIKTSVTSLLLSCINTLACLSVCMCVKVNSLLSPYIVDNIHYIRLVG